MAFFNSCQKSQSLRLCLVKELEYPLLLFITISHKNILTFSQKKSLQNKIFSFFHTTFSHFHTKHSYVFFFFLFTSMYINYSVEVKTFTKHPLLLMTLTRDPHNRTGLLNTMQSSIFRRWGDPKVPACSETKTISENSPKDTLVGVKQHHPPLRTV
jgi:hypothetical protein